MKNIFFKSTLYDNSSKIIGLISPTGIVRCLGNNSQNDAILKIRFLINGRRKAVNLQIYCRLRIAQSYEYVEFGCWVNVQLLYSQWHAGIWLLMQECIITCAAVYGQHWQVGNGYLWSRSAVKRPTTHRRNLHCITGEIIDFMNIH